MVIVGRREDVDLPDWGLEGIEAKVDTGARTSAIDVADIVEFGEGRVRFTAITDRRDPNARHTVEVDIVRRTRVRSSFGDAHDRLFVRTTMRLAGQEFEVELGLVDRKSMLCRMLLGRRALDGAYLVDTGRRFVHGARSSHQRSGGCESLTSMKLAILSRGPHLYSTRRLVEAAKNRGMDVHVLDPLKFAISLEEKNPDLYFDGEPIEDFDAVIPRIGSSVTFFGTAVVRQLEQMEVFSANSAIGIANSRDKLRSLQILSRHDIGMPATEFARRKEDVLAAISRVGGAPVIIKLLEGTQGVGVILADNDKVAEAIIETLQSTKQNVLIQKFVAESKGKDIRAFVVGDRVVAAMRRMAQGQEFRSNVHRGGRAEKVELDEVYAATAVRATQILGLRVAGVDMLEGTDGPQIMEVNSSPGLEGIESATRADVAGAIIDYVREHVRFADIDLRQRLAVTQGYGVAEIPIGEDSELAGETIESSRLREKDVSILTLYRETRAFANPRKDGEILVGDRLLCFGKLEFMKTFLADRRPPRVRKLKAADIKQAGGTTP